MTTSADCVEIFKLLIQYKCNVHYQNYSNNRAPIYCAAAHSPPIFSFMVNRGLFDAKHQCKKMTKKIIEHGRSSQIKEKNITTLCNHIINKFTNGRYIDSTLEQIIQQGFADNLIYFIISLNIFLSNEKIKNWKYFYQSKYIMTRKSINKLKKVIGIDKEWIELLNNMLMAHSDAKLWHRKFEKYNINSNSNERKTDDYFNGQFYNCSNSHRMKHYDTKRSGCDHCSKCDSVSKKNLYKCDICNEYICVDCDYSFKLNQMLKMKLFKQFDQEVVKKRMNGHVMQQVKFS